MKKINKTALFLVSVLAVSLIAGGCTGKTNSSKIFDVSQSPDITSAPVSETTSVSRAESNEQSSEDEASSHETSIQDSSSSDAEPSSIDCMATITAIDINSTTGLRTVSVSYRIDGEEYSSSIQGYFSSIYRGGDTIMITCSRNDYTKILTTSMQTEESEPGPAESSSDNSAGEPSAPESSEESSHNDESSNQTDKKKNIMKTEYKFFYPRLTDQEKDDFAELYTAAAAFEKKAEFTKPIPSFELERLMWLLNYDCPELIHVTGDYMPEYDSEGNISGVGLYYNMDSSEYKECFNKIEEYITELKSEVIGLSDLQKEKYVFDKLFTETVFNEQTKMAGSVYGVLIEHEGRCEGISKSFAWCMNELGIECITLAGQPLWDNNAMYSSHSWNIIKLDGEYYHVDLAADNLKSYPSQFVLPLYSFFNECDSVIYKTRTVYDVFSDLGVPECSSEKLNYHIMNGLFIPAEQDTETVCREILEKKYSDGVSNTLSLRFENEEAYNSFITNWEEWLNEFLEEKGYSCSHEFFCNNVGLTAIIHTVPQ